MLPHHSPSILEVGEGVPELCLHFEHIGVLDHLYLRYFFGEVEDVHGADVVFEVLWDLAVDLDAADGVIDAALLLGRPVLDLLVADHLAAEHSFYVGHQNIVRYGTGVGL